MYLHKYLLFIDLMYNLQDDVIPGQIKQVEQYIIQFNDKQVIINDTSYILQFYRVPGKFNL